MQAGLHHISPTHRLIRHLLRPSPAAPKLLSQASLQEKQPTCSSAGTFATAYLSSVPFVPTVQCSLPTPSQPPYRSNRPAPRGARAVPPSSPPPPAAAPWLTLSVRDSSSPSGCLRRALPHAELGTCTPTLPPYGCSGHPGIPYHSSLISADNRDFCGVRGPKLLHGGT